MKSPLDMGRIDHTLSRFTDFEDRQQGPIHDVIAGMLGPRAIRRALDVAKRVFAPGNSAQEPRHFSNM